MASKLRRTPLFGYDGNLGIPIIPPTSANGTTAAAATVSKTTTTNGQGYKVSKDTEPTFFVVVKRHTRHVKGSFFQNNNSSHPNI